MGQTGRILRPSAQFRRNAACCVSLPVFPELTEKEVDFVIEKTLAWDKSLGEPLKACLNSLVRAAGGASRPDR